METHHRCSCSMRLMTDGALPPSYCNQKTSRLHSRCRFGAHDSSSDHWSRPIRTKYFPLMQRQSSTMCSSIEAFAVAWAAYLLAFGWVDCSWRWGNVLSKLAPECVRISDGSDECCLQWKLSVASALSLLRQSGANSPDNNVNVIANNKSATSPCLQIGLTST